MSFDQNAPLIEYNPAQSYHSWGKEHGQRFKDGIQELARIRKNLMLARNPGLKDQIEGLAQEQAKITESFAPDLWQEFVGIAEGSGLSIEDLVILNNYTDFRDIILPDQGCSTVYARHGDNEVSGQTWDMHSSAKDFVCVISVPAHDGKPAQLLFSLVGCVGMMGYNTYDGMIGINNINTLGAKPGVIWPALVREALNQKTLKDMFACVSKAPVTSGHNYLMAYLNQGALNYEATPVEGQTVSEVQAGQEGRISHFNHCEGDKVQKLEAKEFISSTTHAREKLVHQKINTVTNLKTLTTLLKDHDEHPLSICCHYQSGAQDPSATCGGATGDLGKREYVFWRGCETYDDNYQEYRFARKGNGFCEV